MLSRCGSVAVVAAALVVCLDARQFEAIPLPPIPKGTGTITGVVLDFSGQPAAGAQVSISIHSGRSLVTSSGGYDRTKTVADQDGRFAFTNVTAEPVELRASMANRPDVVYGEVHPGSRGTPIRLREHERMSVRLRLSRGSTMSGRVSDENGAPAPGFKVFVSRLVPRGDDAYLGAGGDTVTDQRGEYRVAGLVAGQYAVWGYRDQPPSFSPPKLIQSGPDQFALEGGAYPPNTPSPCYEPPVALEADRDRSGVDLTWRLEPVTAVRGEVRDTYGHPVPGATVQWAPVAIECTGTSLVKTDGDGAFELTRIKRGDYSLDVSWRNSQVVWSTHAPFSSDGRTPQHLSLVMSSEPAGSVTGRIEFVSRREVVTPTGPTVYYSTVFLNSRLFNDQYEIRGVPSTGARAFEFTGVVSGEYRIHPYAPAGWIVRSALANGRDLLDFPLVVRPGDHIDVVITMSDVFTELTGTITDARGRPSLAHTVVVFAADEQFWATMSRRILVDRPDTHGGFHMSGLPAGEYLVALAPADFENDRPAASMLRELRTSSKRVTLRDGVPATLDLRVSVAK